MYNPEAQVTDLLTQQTTIADKLTRCRAVIKDLLASRQMNVSELARRIHLPQPTIHRLLTGKTEDPKLSTLTFIADYFSITLDQLLGCDTSVSNAAEKKPSLIPVIAWHDAIDSENTLENGTPETWIPTESHSTSSFALISKKSMEPIFHAGSMLLIDTKTTPCDGDIVIVHYSNTNEATVRKLVSDGPTQELCSLFDHTVRDKLTKTISVIGVVMEARCLYK